MTPSIQFVPASSLTLEAFAEIYTRSFDKYFYPMAQSVEGMSARLRVDHIDLHHTVVMLVGGVPAGEATLALRGDRAWCGGFGIVPEYRGRKLGPPLFAECVAQARLAGAKTLQLEVVTRNAPALKVYAGAGMRPTRDLRLLEWKRNDAKPLEPLIAEPADMAAVTTHFHRLHPVSPGWGRELPSLLLRTGLKQLPLMHADDIDDIKAYVLFWSEGGTATIADICAQTPALAAALLLQLQSHHARVVSTNEAVDNPITLAFDQTGFVEFDRQHEMLMTL